MHLNVYAQECKEYAEKLLDRAKRLEAGEELCEHYYSGDPGWECYCTGCGKHLLESRYESGVPFAKDAYCTTCKYKKKIQD